MLLQRSSISSTVAVILMLVAGCGLAENPDRPQVIEALQAQGLTVVQEFDVGSDLRAFAGVAGEQPIAVYVSREGHAIVGTRLDAKGEPLDESTLQDLVAKPMGEQVWKQLESATWVLDGKADAPRIVYTFSDANCPYCNRFWQAARPWVDSGKVQIRHLLVGIIREDSPAKAVAILSAPDRSAALLENETTFNQGGITPVKNISADMRKILADNKMLMLSTGFQGTPGIVVRHDNGVVQKYNGMPQPESLNEVLGPR